MPVMISIHASRGGSDKDTIDRLETVLKISIHASRGGSDLHEQAPDAVTVISIHASRGGSDVYFTHMLRDLV